MKILNKSLALLMLILVSVAAEVIEEKATITSIVGNVEIRSNATANWRKARIGMPVNAGGDIRTYLESTAEVSFETGTILKIGENSVVILSKMLKNSELNATKSSIKVGTGQIWANVKKLTNKSSEFDFETPTAVASIRGTRLGINVNDSRTSIDVYEGIVMVHKKGSEIGLPLTTRNRAVVSSSSEAISVVDFKNIDIGEKNSSPPADPFTAAADSVNKSQKDTTAAHQDSSNGLFTIEVSSPQKNAIVKETPVIVKGFTKPGATVVVFDKVIDVGNDGSFVAMVDLKNGSNLIPVMADFLGKFVSYELPIEYHPPLLLNIVNATDNMVVSSLEITLEIEVSEGARFTVNGTENLRRVSLNAGQNVIKIEAWDSWKNSTTKLLNINYSQSKEFVLNIISPLDGAVIKDPIINVSGNTIDDARITVNDLPVQVVKGGFFTTRVPLPEEPQEYNVEIRAQFNGKELTSQRRVVYKPALGPLSLDIVTPTEGGTINKPQIHVSGKTLPKATVTVNGHLAIINGSGVFTCDIPVSEKNIGDLSLDIVARTSNDEIAKNITVTVDGSSSSINTSVPALVIPQSGQQATNRNKLQIQCLDRTPGDQITLSITNNGVPERLTTESGSVELYTLTEGKNVYTIKAFDNAGNPSNVISGTLYYLPGPLSVNINEPSSNPYVIKGLPPLPRGYATPQQQVEIEIDDGIQNIPETIKYCRLIGNGQTIQLRNNKDYRYRGNVSLQRGTNSFVIQAEDLAGNALMSRLEVELK